MDLKITDRIRSIKWIRSLDRDLADVLIYHGLEDPEDILDLRLFDLLNLYKIDAGRAESILVSLYSLLNSNKPVDQAMAYGEITQPFSYAEWNRRHRRIGTVKVRDIVLAEDINRKAVIHLTSRIIRAFHKSEEYNPRLYKYASIYEIEAVNAKESAK